MGQEDESLKAENKELEKTLKRLEAGVKKAQPVAEFTIGERQKGKRR
jgi:hypothetical protein